MRRAAEEAAHENEPPSSRGSLTKVYAAKRAVLMKTISMLRRLLRLPYRL
jgi:hypothetical protein